MKPAIIDIVGIGPAAASTLAEHGFRTIRSLARTTVEKLSAVPGFSEARAGKVIAAAGELLPGQPATGGKPAKTDKGAKKDKKGKDKKKGGKGKKNKKEKKGKKGKGKKK